jgi:uncharacterized protein (TIGR00255 family)
MTGFGEARREAAGATLHVQIRTVNHRHLNIHFKVPEALEALEPAVTAVLKERLVRGHVRYRLDLSEPEDADASLTVDHDRVRAYVAALEQLKFEHGIVGDVDLDLVARFGDIFRTAATFEDGIDLEPVLEATRAALDDVVETREREGKALESDLLASIAAIETAAEAIAERAPGRLERERDRLKQAIAELSGEVGVDEDRLAREVAYLAERWDINEELVRLRSHVASFRETVQAEGDEPVGKRLGFWLQEMHREANTIGAKANDSEIVGQVVGIKTEIEKLREQVENVE